MKALFLAALAITPISSYSQVQFLEPLHGLSKVVVNSEINLRDPREKKPISREAITTSIELSLNKNGIRSSSLDDCESMEDVSEECFAGPYLTLDAYLLGGKELGVFLYTIDLQLTEVANLRRQTDTREGLPKNIMGYQFVTSWQKNNISYCAIDSCASVIKADIEALADSFSLEWVKAQSEPYHLP